MVREDRAREIALAVLDQHRSFPNAIVLATDRGSFDVDGCYVRIPSKVKFLVVDGQHRLWAQKYSNFDAQYACTIHAGLNEVEMARLFLEINDNQRRVPSSLRWDLVRLVRPDDNPQAIGAAEIIYQLANDTQSPLYQRIDLTGEQSEIQLKQASLAPELSTLLSKKSPLAPLTFDQQYDLIIQYLIAVKSLDPDRWGKSDYPIYKARVLRSLLRLIPHVAADIKKPIVALTHKDFMPILAKIDRDSLDSVSIRAIQGNAGIKAIFDLLIKQISKRSK
jgi:DNA sulfur modification protein DndB